MNTLSAILWNPDIEIFSIFGISIRYYSVLFVTGLSLAYWVIYKLYQDQKFLTKIWFSVRLLPAGYCYRCSPGTLSVLWARLLALSPCRNAVARQDYRFWDKMDRLSRSCQPWRNHRTNARLMDLFTPCKIEVPDCTRQYSHRHPAGRLFYPFR